MKNNINGSVASSAIALALSCVPFSHASYLSDVGMPATVHYVDHSSEISNIQGILDGALWIDSDKVESGDAVMLKGNVGTVYPAFSVDTQGLLIYAEDAPLYSTGGTGVADDGWTSSVKFQNDVTVNASGVTIYGIQFEDASLTINGDGAEVARCVFSDHNDNEGKALTVDAKDVMIRNNEFRRNKSRGIAVSSGTHTGIVIKRNYFHDFTADNNDGNVHEPIQFGYGHSTRAEDTGALIRYNYILRCSHDAEAISVKTSGNTISYNYVLDSDGSHGDGLKEAGISNRFGMDNFYIGNHVENSGGYIVYDEFSTWYNNKITAGSGMKLMKGSYLLTQSPPNSNDGCVGDHVDPCAVPGADPKEKCKNKYLAAIGVKGANNEVGTIVNNAMHGDSCPPQQYDADNYMTDATAPVYSNIGSLDTTKTGPAFYSGGPSNTAPVASDDSTFMLEDSIVDIDVLGNDSDLEGDTLTPLIVADGSNGVATVLGSGDIQYSPNSGYYGTDSFVYKVNDGSLDSNNATVTVVVNEFVNPLVPSRGLVPYSVMATENDGADNSAANVMDSNFTNSSYWAGSNTGDNPALYFDLGAEYLVDEVSIAYKDSGTRRYDVTIEVAPSSGSPWVSVHSGLSNWFTPGSGNYDDYSFSPQTAQYVRITGDGYTTGSSPGEWTTITEVAIEGTSVGPGGTNLIANSGFETAGAWSYDGVWSRSSSDSDQGSYSAHTPANGTWNNLHQVVSVDAYSDYTLSVRAKGSGGGMALKVMDDWTTLPGAEQAFDTTGSWQEYSITFNSGSLTQVRISVADSKNGSHTYVDEVSLTED